MYFFFSVFPFFYILCSEFVQAYWILFNLIGFKMFLTFFVTNMNASKNSYLCFYSII